jgi:hypothetical protein
MPQISKFNKSWQVFVYLKQCRRKEGNWIGMWLFMNFSLYLVGRKLKAEKVLEIAALSEYSQFRRDLEFGFSSIEM